MHKSDWQTFITEHSRGERNAEIAKRLGTSPSNISRWMSGTHRPDPQMAVDFANAYSVNPISALIAAGHITKDSLGIHAPVPGDLTEISTAQLLDELQRRLREFRDTLDRLDNNTEREALEALVNALAGRHTEHTNVGGVDDTSDTLSHEEAALLLHQNSHALAADNRPGRDEEAEADLNA